MKISFVDLKLLAGTSNLINTAKSTLDMCDKILDTHITEHSFNRLTSTFSFLVECTGQYRYATVLEIFCSRRAIIDLS